MLVKLGKGRSEAQSVEKRHYYVGGGAGVNTNTHNTRVLVYQGNILFSTLVALFFRRNPSVNFVEIFGK